MNSQLLILFSVCLGLTSAELINNIASTNETSSVRAKRQIPLSQDFSFMDYSSYDYYDWVCNNQADCQLCDVLTGACCDPENNLNCFLPDSCANNPCLSGGTCINTETVAPNPGVRGFYDFTCVCIRGLTGKYCQLIDDFTPTEILPIPDTRPIPVGVAPQQRGPINNGFTNAFSQAGNPAAARVANGGLGGAAATRMGGIGGGMGSIGGGLPGMGGIGGGLNAMGGMGRKRREAPTPTAFGSRVAEIKKRESEIASTLFKNKD